MALVQGRYGKDRMHQVRALQGQSEDLALGDVENADPRSSPFKPLQAATSSFVQLQSYRCIPAYWWRHFDLQ
jgi:hypothetical protein